MLVNIFYFKKIQKLLKLYDKYSLELSVNNKPEVNAIISLKMREISQLIGLEIYSYINSTKKEKFKSWFLDYILKSYSLNNNSGIPASIDLIRNNVNFLTPFFTKCKNDLAEKNIVYNPIFIVPDSVKQAYTELELYYMNFLKMYNLKLYYHLGEDFISKKQKYIKKLDVFNNNKIPYLSEKETEKFLFNLKEKMNNVLFNLENHSVVFSFYKEYIEYHLKQGLIDRNISFNRSPVNEYAFGGIVYLDILSYNHYFSYSELILNKEIYT